MITDSKLSLVQIGDMRLFLDRLCQAGEHLNVTDLENVTGNVLRKCEDLFKTAATHKNMLLELKTELLRQRGNVEAAMEGYQKELVLVANRGESRDQVGRAFQDIPEVCYFNLSQF